MSPEGVTSQCLFKSVPSPDKCIELCQEGHKMSNLWQTNHVNHKTYETHTRLRAGLTMTAIGTVDLQVANFHWQPGWLKKERRKACP